MTFFVYFGVIITAAFTAANAALFVAQHKPFSLGAAIFCGAMFVWTLINAVRL